MSAATARRVGIDLGTTFSSLAVLDRHGHPVSVPNAAGELATPSAVLFEPGGKAVVGTEAARTALSQPDRVVQQAKRFLGHAGKVWRIDGNAVTPTDASALILRSLLGSARARFGELTEAVITVPAQFGEAERGRTVAAGKAAGLRAVTLIDEPVAAALCHILAGSEGQEGGLWFTELAEPTTVLVFDFGGGTLDLALVEYGPDGVRVRAVGGDPELGGLDFTKALSDALAGQFARENADLDFLADPREDPESDQDLANEAEEVKRSLSVREATQATLTHSGRRKAYKVDREQLDRLTAPLVARAEGLVKDLVREHSKGWGEIDAVLLTGGTTRVPAVRAMLRKLAGTTPCTELSPDLSVAHGACLYAGLLAQDAAVARTLLGTKSDAGEWREKLATAVPAPRTGRGLGVLVKDDATGERRPHYLIPPNSPLPASASQTFGLFRAGQRRVRVKVVQAGPTPDRPPTQLGECLVEPLPEGLPENAPVEIALTLDASGLLHASAVEKTSGTRAEAKLVRPGDAVAGPDDDLPASPAAAGEKAVAAPPPPAPGRTGTEAAEGESEFWKMVEPPARKRRRSAR